MTTSPQTATLLPMTVSFSERLSETWLLERTYHAQLRSAEAIKGFQRLPPRDVSSRSQVQTVFPQFCYYHEVTCPSGVYRIEFFGPRMDERGYQVKEAA